MDYQKVKQNPKIIKQINNEFNLIETSHDKFKRPIVYCTITEKMCDELQSCQHCEIAKKFNEQNAESNILSIFPTIKHNNCLTNIRRTILQGKTLDDFGCMLWIHDSIHYKTLTEEQLSKYNLWYDIKDIYLETDEIVDYMYLENYPLIINFKNSVLMISPLCGSD